MSSSVIKIIVKILIAVVAVYAYYYFSLSSTIEELAKTQNNIYKINIELLQADKKLQNLKDIKKDENGLNIIADKVATYWPDDTETSSFIIILEKTTTEIPLIVDSLSTNVPKNDKSTTKKTKDKTETVANDKHVEFTASLRSSYDNILTFFSKMENLSRYNSIESVSIGSFKKEDQSLGLSVKGKIYYGK